MKKLLIFLALALPMMAESRGHKLLKWSWGALVAGNVADSASSWGRPELNPVLGPRFGSRSTAIKFAVTGAVIGVEALLTRKHSELERPFAWGNFAMTGVLTGIAVRNYRLPSSR